MRVANVIARSIVAMGALYAAAGLAAAPAPGSTSNGEAAAAVCRACHTFHAAQPNGAGPNLHGLFGRRAGSVTGFAYSPALKASGIVWNEQALNEFLAAPAKRVPGTRMPISVTDPAKRAAVIAYLKAETAK